jgi:hypothetical protein
MFEIRKIYLRITMLYFILFYFNNVYFAMKCVNQGKPFLQLLGTGQHTAVAVSPNMPRF